ncbi:unnamed protein product [Orchesella dallaii]|uniref:Uncharacterized protein n=1 Tax=Orchesella dallaii TaxID=48710 RepID=A0ABP1QWX1_9HEXA
MIQWVFSFSIQTFSIVRNGVQKKGREGSFCYTIQHTHLQQWLVTYLDVNLEMERVPRITCSRVQNLLVRR